MGRESKEMKRKLLVKKTMSNINQFIAKLEKQKHNYIESAKKAKLGGMSAQYNLALSGLKTAIAQQKKAQEMLLNIELTAQMRDLTKTTSSFLGGMSVISKEMTKIVKNMDFEKIHKEFEKAMYGVEETTEKLDMLLEDSETSFENISNQQSQISDDELDKLVSINVAGEVDKLDKEIESKIEDIKKSLIE